MTPSNRPFGNVMTDVVDLRLHCIRTASAALRRAGYRIIAPLDSAVRRSSR